MITTDASRLSQLIVHGVGNKFNDEPCTFSKDYLNPELDIKELLSRYFLSTFKYGESYNFIHEASLSLNEIYVYASKIFNHRQLLLEQSIDIVKHLYEQSIYPQIKSGELYIGYFTNCLVEEKVVDAIGIFKSETKDTFLKVYNSERGYDIAKDIGININKLDKGCLIFNIDKENGYVVAVVDNTNKGEDAKYWIDDFLHVRPRKDEYYNTHNVLTLCKNFVTKELPQQFDMQKADQADLLNRSVQFFKEKDSFDMEEFTNEVFAQPEVIDSFNKYKENYEQDRDLEIADNFTISESAVKKQARAFKSVIKLDKNFHIYVHGNRNLIEQGEDEKGKFYKVYYQEES